MNPETPHNHPQPSGSKQRLGRPSPRSAALATPAVVMAFLLIVAAGAGAFRWVSADQPALIEANADTATAPAFETAASPPPEPDPATGFADAGDDAADEVDDAAGDDSTAVTQCEAIVDELMQREDAGVFDDSVEDEGDELDEDELEDVTMEGEEFDGGVDDPDDDDGGDGEARFDGFDNMLDTTQLSDADLLRGVESCFESGVLTEDEGEEDEQDGDDVDEDHEDCDFDEEPDGAEDADPETDDDGDGEQDDDA